MKRLLLPLLTLLLLLMIAVPASAHTVTPYSGTLTWLLDDPDNTFGSWFPEAGPSVHARDLYEVLWFQATDPRATGRLVVQVDINANYAFWLALPPEQAAPVMRSHSWDTLYVQDSATGDVLGVWEGTTTGEFDLMTMTSTMRTQARGISGIVEGLRLFYAVTESHLPGGTVTCTGYIIEP